MDEKERKDQEPDVTIADDKQIIRALVEEINENNKIIRQKTDEIAKWKKLALKASEQACFECERFSAKCEKCKIGKIKEEASNV